MQCWYTFSYFQFELGPCCADRWNCFNCCRCFC